MKIKIAILFLGLILAVASCSVEDDELKPRDTSGKLVNKKWYLQGKSGQNWVLYKTDGSWGNHMGDKGKWSLDSNNVLTIKAEKDLMTNWEEEILEITDTYMKKKMKGVAIAQEYSTTP